MTSDIDPMARIKVAVAAIEAMMARASRIVAIAEGRQMAVMPADTFRMNLMAIKAALSGETRAEQIAIDDDGAAVIAEILNEARGQLFASVPRKLIEKARRAYLVAARAGEDVAAHPPNLLVSPSQYRAVAAAASILGDLLILFPSDSSERESDAK